MQIKILVFLPIIFLQLILSPPIQADSYTLDGVIAYWRFEGRTEGEVITGNPGGYSYNGVIIDETGNGNHLSVWGNNDADFLGRSNTFGSIVQNTSQLNESCVENMGPYPSMFTKSSSANPTTDVETADFSKFTIEVSYRPVQGNTWRTIVGRDAQIPGSPSSALYLQITPNNAVRFSYIDKDLVHHSVATADGYIPNNNPGSLTDNWYHISVSSNGSKLHFRVKIDDPNQFSFVSLVDLNPTTNPDIYVGTGSGSDWHAGGWSVARGLFNGVHTDRALGMIDEVRISNKYATHSQVLTFPPPSLHAKKWVDAREGTGTHVNAQTPHRSIVRHNSVLYGGVVIGGVEGRRNTRLQVLKSTDNGITWGNLQTFDFLPDDHAIHDLAFWSGVLPNETEPRLLVAYGVKDESGSSPIYSVNLLEINNPVNYPTVTTFSSPIFTADSSGKFTGSPFLFQLSDGTLQAYFDWEQPGSSNQFIGMKPLTISGNSLSVPPTPVIASRAPHGLLSRDGMPTVTMLRADPLKQGNDTLLLVTEGVKSYIFNVRQSDSQFAQRKLHHNVIYGIIGYNGGKTNNDWDFNNDRSIIYASNTKDDLGRPYNAYNAHVERLSDQKGPAVVSFMTDEPGFDHAWPADYSYQWVVNRRGQLRCVYSTNNFKTWSDPMDIFLGESKDGTNIAYFNTLFRTADGELITLHETFTGRRVHKLVDN
ncbi:hypothetical protein [Poriferisphaera sp. WC338]|uniref:hypothetical protein n=1 Tax=Poriferisphaera sp. WC338 TaxID=3425129 RepID=UPI003D815A7E